MALYPLVRPLAFALDAERAHRLTVRALKLLPAGLPAERDPMLAMAVAGIEFPNPVGLAAGFDKDAEVFRQMLGFGFGFVEVGTLTPRAQAGNPKPRLFRLAEDRAVINRMGFNNRGQACGAGAAGETQPEAGGSWRQHRREQGERGPDRRLCGRDRGDDRRCRLSDGQRLLAEHAGAPGACKTKERSMRCSQAVIEMRGAGPPVFLKVAPDLDPGQIETSPGSRSTGRSTV